MLAPTTSSCCRTEERAGEAVDAVQLAKQSENDAKRRMAELQRKLSKRKAAEERKKVEQQKQEVAREIRSFARNDKLRKMLQGASAASDEEMQELSLSFNLRMHELFNDASDATWTKLFRHISGTLDPRIGRGFYNTFNANIPILRWALDHIFHTNDFFLNKIRRLPHIGSDHFPMYV